jgi:hypothetical protein
MLRAQTATPLQLSLLHRYRHHLATQPRATPPPPGDYSSRSRFTRMALLRAATLKACWPTQVGNDTQTLSPGVLPPGGSYPADNPALLAVLGVLQPVYLPRGEWKLTPMWRTDDELSINPPCTTSTHPCCLAPAPPPPPNTCKHRR